MSNHEEGLVTATRVAVGRAMAMDDVSRADALVQLILDTKSVATEEQCQSIVDAGKACALAEKKLKEQLDSITRPANESVKAARSLAAPRLDLFKRGKDAALALYRDFTERKRREETARQLEQQKIEREAAAAREVAAKESEACGFDGDLPPEASVYVPPSAPLIRGGIGGATMVKTKKFRVTELNLAISHHPELFDIKLRQNDAKAELANLRRMDPDATLVGIEEYEDESPRMA